ncbi:MAG: DMT family transporter [Bacteroidetes bacterium]|nr:DMT family transporter [Bacteroidota bacterium]
MNIYFILFFQQLLAAGTHLVAKTVTVHVDPVVLTFLRNSISLAVMLVMFMVRERRIRVSREDIPRLLWLSFLAVPLNQFLYLYGIKFTLAANGALLYAMTPALVLVLSFFLLKEAMTRLKVIGIALAFAGITIVIFERGVDFSSDYAYGNIMIFIAVIAWALFAIQGKILVKKYGAFHITVLSMIGGAVMFLPVGLTQIALSGFPEISMGDWGGILYLSLGTSVVSYMLWFYALGRMDTSKVAVFANAQPILTTILAVLLLDQPVTAAFLVGGGITIAGVLLTQRSRT